MNPILFVAVLLCSQRPDCLCGPECCCEAPCQCSYQKIKGSHYIYPTLERGKRAAARLGANLVCFVGDTTQAQPPERGKVVYCSTRAIDVKKGAGVLIGRRIGKKGEIWFWFPDIRPIIIVNTVPPYAPYVPYTPFGFGPFAPVRVPSCCGPGGCCR